MLYMDSLSSFVIMQLWFCQVKYIIPNSVQGSWSMIKYRHECDRRISSNNKDSKCRSKKFKPRQTQLLMPTMWPLNQT